jgi:uroporphyrinogen decarboxylase
MVTDAPIQGARAQGHLRSAGQSHAAGNSAAGLVAPAAGLCVAALGLRRAQRRLRASRGAVVACSGIKTAADAGVTTEHAPDLREAPDNLPEFRAKAWEKVEKEGGVWPAPKNDRLLRAARGETNDRAPKWMMRQAGRYLPEYQAVLKASDFFTVCQTPALACEVTLQPPRRYKTLDSMIIFSDILVIPVAMGMPCGMVEGVGPQFEFAIETPEDLEKLNMKPNVKDTLSYVFDAVFLTRQYSNNEIPVIGFAGAPWTLMGYMVEGGAVRSFDRAKKWLYLYPEASRQLLTALRDIVVEYLVGQYDSGAPMLQVFDTNCGEIPPGQYEEFMVADLKYIATEVKKRRPNAILSLFPKDGELETFNDSDYDVIGVSWKTSPAEARRMCPDKTLQGNFDPYCLYAPPADIKATAQKMVKEFGVDRYIANLGHGMMPTHPVEGPQAFTDGVDSVSRDEAP